MTVYLYSVSDVSPNALRSTYNPDRFYLGKSPCRTNQSGEERVNGPCGTTNDSSVHALGEYDTDDDEWIDDVESSSDETTVDRVAVAAWLESDTDDDFELDPAPGESESAAFTWNETSDDCDFYPSVRDGWTLLASYDTNTNDIECLSAAQCRSLNNGFDTSSPGSVKRVMDAAGIKYDYQIHERYNRRNHGTDWEVIAVRDDDADAATRAIVTATSLFECDAEWDGDDVERMVAAAFAKAGATV